MATRATKQTPTTGDDETPDDGVPSFTTPKKQPVKYDGPVLFRANGREYRMRSGPTFASSLVWLNAVRRGATVRNAEFTVIEALAGPAALDALLKVPDLDAAKWGVVVRRAYDHMLGSVGEEPEGN